MLGMNRCCRPHAVDSELALARSLCVCASRWNGKGWFWVRVCMSVFAFRLEAACGCFGFARAVRAVLALFVKIVHLCVCVSEGGGVQFLPLFLWKFCRGYSFWWCVFPALVFGDRRDISLLFRCEYLKL